MAGSPPKKPAAPGGAKEKSKFKEVNRGTQDELEIIGLIITQNVGLRTLVMDRLRQAKIRGKAREDVRKSRASDDAAS